MGTPGSEQSGVVSKKRPLTPDGAKTSAVEALARIIVRVFPETLNVALALSPPLQSR